MPGYIPNSFPAPCSLIHESGASAWLHRRRREEATAPRVPTRLTALATLVAFMASAAQTNRPGPVFYIPRPLQAARTSAGPWRRAKAATGTGLRGAKSNLTPQARGPGERTQRRRQRAYIRPVRGCACARCAPRGAPGTCSPRALAQPHARGFCRVRAVPSARYRTLGSPESSPGPWAHS